MGKVKKILVPFDFSTPSKEAFRWAMEWERLINGKLIVITVPENPNKANQTDPLYVNREQLEEHLRNLLENKTLFDQSIDKKFDVRILEGDIIEEIINIAEDESIDIIVMGSHGREGLSRALMGSVTEGVLRKAPCPVVVIKDKTFKSSTEGVLQ